MNNFNISFTDLTAEAQERVKGIVRERIRGDGEQMEEIQQLAKDRKKEWPSLSLPDRFSLILEDIVDAEISRKFNAKGEV